MGTTPELIWQASPNRSEVSKLKPAVMVSTRCWPGVRVWGRAGAVERLQSAKLEGVEPPPKSTDAALTVTEVVPELVTSMAPPSYPGDPLSGPCVAQHWGPSPMNTVLADPDQGVRPAALSAYPSATVTPV